MIKGVIFDLDGVIVSTDDFHYEAWKKIADEENIYFDREINNRLRGVSRMESLEIILEKATKTYTEEEKEVLAERKNTVYVENLENLNEKNILNDVLLVLDKLKKKGIKIAIGSSSKNTKLILEKIGLRDAFDEIADGSEIKNSKPSPDVFLLAAQKLQLPPKYCAVVEDASAGIAAANAAGMLSFGVGDASKDMNADHRLNELKEILEILGL